MALVVYDRVQETTATTGTGSITLGGAVAGYQSFAVVGNGNTTFYCIVNGSAWEVGIGTYSTTGPTLARTTVLSNSDGNISPITLAGASSVFVTYPSEKSVNLNASGNVSPLGTITSGVWNGTTIPVVYGGTGVTASSGANSVVLRDADQNISVNSIVQNIAVTTSAAGTTTLTSASAHFQILIGSTTQTYKLPDATSLPTGTTFIFDNDSTGNLFVVNNASGAVDTVAPGGYASVFLEINGTTAGTWGRYGFIPSEVNWGTNSLDLGGSTVITNGIWNGTPIAYNYGGTGLTTFTAANNALYSTSASALTAGTLPILAGGTGATVANGAMANLMGFTSTATAAGTTTLTNTSSYYQLFTGTTTQTIVLPVTSTLQTGWTFHICNNSTGTLAINSSGGNSIYSSIPSGVTVMVTCIATGGTTAADWEAGFTDFSTSTGTGSVVLNAGPTFTGTAAFASISASGSINFNTTASTITLGSASNTTAMTFGLSTVSQTTNIQAGATASGSTKTMNIGTGGLTGSTTAISIGSTFGTSVTANGTWTYSTPLAATNMVQATTSTSGYLSNTDWNTFNNKSNTTGTVTSVGGTGSYGGLTLTGTVTSSGNLTLGGTPTGTWPISVSGNSATATNVAYSGLTGTVPTWNQNTTGTASYANSIESTAQALGYSLSAQNVDYGGQGGPQVRSQGSGAAMMSFHRPGSYAINFGLGTDNQLRVGGWSRSGSYVVLDSGNYNSYSPTLGGTGASGTWGINVTGSSASCTGNAASVTINYNNDSNSTYQMLWGSGNGVYGTSQIYCNPATDYLYSGAFYCGNWFRSTGNSGWYSETYGGGVFMQDTTWVRTYNSKSFLSDGTIYAGSNMQSPIFYDANDTAWYTDPASESRINRLTMPSNVGSGTFPMSISSVDRGIVFGNSSGSAISCYFTVNSGATVSGYISPSGGSTSYVTSSDARLKTLIGQATDTSVIDNTVINDFTWNVDGKVDRGVFAQDAYLVKPSAVNKGIDKEDGTIEIPWGVDYAKYVPDLIVYCQTLKKTIAALETRIAVLEGK